MDLDLSVHSGRFKCIDVDMLNLNGKHVGFRCELPNFERIGEGSVNMPGFALENLLRRRAITDIEHYKVYIEQCR